MKETFVVVVPHEVAVTHAPVTYKSVPQEPEHKTTGTPSSTLSTGAIIGIVIGCVGGVILILFLIWYFNNRS